MALVLLIALGTAAADEPDIKLGQFIPANPPQPAPQTEFKDMIGKPVRLGDFKGKPVIVNLWATWCVPCLAEMPSLNQLQGKLSGKLTILAISEDHAGAKQVEPFVDKLKLGNLSIYLDPNGDLLHDFAVRGLPTSIVINTQGEVVGRLEGASDWTSPQIAAILQPLLTQGKPAVTKTGD